MGRPSKEETIEVCYESEHLKLGKDQDFIMASFILTVSYIRLEMFEQCTPLFMCKSHLKCLHSFI